MAKRAATKEDKIIALLEGLVSRVEKLESNNSTPKPEVSQQKPKRGRPKKAAVNKHEKDGRPNLFESMAEFNDYKDLSKENEKIKKKRRPPIRRPRFEPMTMPCSVCKKSCKVSPGELMPDSPYRCSDCITGRRS